MRILVISRNAWDDTNAIGNTMSNFFKRIENVEFASIYFRSSSPNNELCECYYQTSEMEILKKWFFPQRIGRKFYFSKEKNSERKHASTQNEQALIHMIKKYGVKMAYRISDSLWYSKKWINGNLKQFIESFSPDLIFTFAKSAPQYYLTVRYLREKFQIPLLTWIADDEYTVLLKNNSQREIENLKYILNESSVVRGCSQEICDYYNSIFNCNATPLYKGCEFSASVKDKVSEPIKMVYAGNLLYGRLEIIKRIADVLESSEIGVQKVRFDIYSNTLLDEIEEAFFSHKTCTKYMGRKDYETIKRVLSESDIVLYVESFESSEIAKTKYSFSTKIIDYLQSGSILLAIGPNEISSIKYIKKIPGAYVIDDLGSLRENFLSLVRGSVDFIHRAEQIRNFADKYHNVAINAEDLKKTIETLLRKEG